MYPAQPARKFFEIKPCYRPTSSRSKTCELSNHLGNVLATISDRRYGVSSNGSTIDHFNPVVLDANDYYPFGSLEPGRTYDASTFYRYGFNGKENDNEVKGEGDQQDYGMRIYDPRVGRFLSVDPIKGKYPELTPYQFSSNTPVWAVDQDGREAKVVVVKETTKAVLRVAAKDGVEQGAKVIALHSAPELLPLGARILGGILGIVVDVLTPDYEGPNAPHGNEIRNPIGGFNVKPSPNSSTVPDPALAPAKDKEDDDDNKPKVFYVTYTKSKVLPDGTVSTYSGRTSGTYTGNAPTTEEAQAAVDSRDASHTLLRSEDYGNAILDKVSTSYAAIRGREQQLVDYYGGAQRDGGTSRNKIRAVGRRNPLRAIYNTMATIRWGGLRNNNPRDQQAH